MDGLYVNVNTSWSMKCSSIAVVLSRCRRLCFVRYVDRVEDGAESFSTVSLLSRVIMMVPDVILLNAVVFCSI